MGIIPRRSFLKGIPASLLAVLGLGGAKEQASRFPAETVERVEYRVVMSFGEHERSTTWEADYDSMLRKYGKWRRMVGRPVRMEMRWVEVSRPVVVWSADVVY